jgi:hypothetical protein
MQILTYQPLLSRLSIFLSSLCVIHCLSVPIVIILLPALSGFFTETVETIFILSVVPISAFGFFPKWLAHKNYALLIGYFSSIAIMIISHFGFHHFGSHNHLTESIFLIIGAALLGVMIYKNNRHTHVCKNPHHHHHHD